MLAAFRELYSDIGESQIHSYYFCKSTKCQDIPASDKSAMKKDNKFQHKWIFDPELAKCQHSIKKVGDID